MSGGNKLGVLRKQVGYPSTMQLKEIESIETEIKQGIWGKVPGDDPAAGKAAGLLCVSALGRGPYTKTVWYQIGVDSKGKAFAELGWRAGPSTGTMLKTYKYPITKDTVLKMIPKGNTVEFRFGNNIETLTWNQYSTDWNAGTGSYNPNFDWNDTNKIYWIHQQIEAFWGKPSSASKIGLPGTESNPFVFGPTKYKEPSKVDATTISGKEFLPLLTGNDSTFRHQPHQSDSTKVELYRSTNP
jgi:hypothetical protein